ncbi:MAG: hypothetical protein IT427_01650 [Pirellulales bacterium]|nr:hypothetical protein [Pirellulales bacterium]
MKRPHRASPHVNLLPLLDVLLCTMGTLIVVLGVLNQRPKTSTPDSSGRIRLSATAAERAAEEEGFSIACEQLQLRIDQLAKAREKTAAELETARQRLSHIEDHSRQIRTRIEDLQLATRQLPDPDSATDGAHDALRAELLRMNVERRRLEADLNSARKEARYRKPAFAVVPYDGIHKTHRRPIYIECRADAVIIQPEGIVFTAADFLGPEGPGNPLASALRAAREYWGQQPPPSPDEKNEPYPLLLVRPDGISGYVLARNALSSWGSEFGYELIDADWKLDYPLPPQTQLKEMAQRAVADARQRLRWMAQTSPERFARKSTVQYRLSPTGGGLVPTSGMGMGRDPFERDPLGGFGRSAFASSRGELRGDRNGIGTGGGHGGSGLAPEGSGIGTDPTGSDLSGGAAAGRNGMPAGPMGNLASGDDESVGSGECKDGGIGGTGNQANSAGSQPGGNQNQFGGLGDRQFASGGNGALATGDRSIDGSTSNGPGRASGRPIQEGVGRRYAGFDGNGFSGEGQPGSLSSQNSQSLATNSHDRAAHGMPSGTANGSAGEATNGSFGNNSGGSSTGASSGSSAGQSASSGQPSMAAGMPSPTLELNANQPRTTASSSLADARGRNWALPSDSSVSVPIRRPIRIECWPDRIVVMSDSRDRLPQVIPLTERTEESVDQLVGAIRDHTSRWGIAGHGMYWKPQLMLQVNPNGEARANDLQILLANSGLDVKRK